MKTLLTRLAAALAALCAVCLAACAQQVADPDVKASIARPAYREGRGPVVLFDEAHNTCHAASGRYQPFAELLRRHGYRVEASAAPCSQGSLKRARVLVVSNAIETR